MHYRRPLENPRRHAQILNHRAGSGRLLRTRTDGMHIHICTFHRSRYVRLYTPATDTVLGENHVKSPYTTEKTTLYLAWMIMLMCHYEDV